ncbi:class II glutamine amidotransferase [Alsobacter metallidurans]|uniref:Class II glutamine amidotransferase n=1 Tax=Alsobacter metallidurans TaxID=340221 RepID=A0A917MG16_9HYPH|nr:class II glutamine amidotransferase [Alsobacter metallidurans]GGH07549.1 class II glutamine amidotransferase [Alsobacter metallidurans]
MCRFLAYRGEPVFMEDLVSAPCHSLVHQSLHAEEAKTGTNGDGFGIGWYATRPEPGVYRELRPAWSDENLQSLCAQVRSGLFFAHVRAATGTATTRANCHPFVQGRWMFMHNGQIGGYHTVRRKLEAMIPDALYEARGGTTDSEAIFLAALADGLEDDPVGAVARTVSRVSALMQAAGVREALRFTAALTDGEDLYAFRWASDGKPATLYWRDLGDRLIIVSEPLDRAQPGWLEVPRSCVLTARKGQAPALQCMDEAITRAAA